MHSSKLLYNGKLHINIPSLIEGIIIFVLFERILIQLGLSGSIIYIIDLANIVLFLACLYKQAWKYVSSFILLYFILIVVSVATAIINYAEWGGSPLHTIIELRNVVRFPIFFVACVSYLTPENCKRIYKILVVFFFASSLVSIYQYFTWRPAGIWTRGDHLNGLFGTAVGGNTYVNVLMLVAVTYLLAGWSNGTVRTGILFAAVALSLLIAALIELKAFFIEFIIVYLFYLIKKKKTPKEIKINIILIGLVTAIAFVGLEIMFREYPWFRDTMTFRGMINSLTNSGGYTGAGDLNRFTGVFTIAKEIFNGEWVTTFLGLGLGNGSAFSLGDNSTNFFNIYQNTHYNWFSGTYMFIQCGALGLAIYLFSFVVLLAKRKLNRSCKLNSEMMCLLALFLVFYGEALKTDAGYIVYFALASGFVNARKTNNNINMISPQYTDSNCSFERVKNDAEN